MNSVAADETSSAVVGSSGFTEGSCRTQINNSELFSGWSSEELQQVQRADPDNAAVLAWIKASEECPLWPIVFVCCSATKAYWSQWKWLYIRDGTLVRRFYCLDDIQFCLQVVLPQVFWSDIMIQMHEGQVGGHFWGRENCSPPANSILLVQNERGCRPLGQHLYQLCGQGQTPEDTMSTHGHC